MMSASLRIFSRWILAGIFVIQSTTFAQQGVVSSPPSPPAPPAAPPVPPPPSPRVPGLFYPNCDPQNQLASQTPPGKKIVWGLNCEKIDVTDLPFGEEMHNFQALEYTVKDCQDLAASASQDKAQNQTTVGKLGADCTLLKDQLAHYEEIQNKAQNCVDTQEPKTCVGPYLTEIVPVMKQAFDTRKEIHEESKSLGQTTEGGDGCSGECAVQEQAAAQLQEATCCGFLQEREGAMSPNACSAFLHKKMDISSCASTIIDTIGHSLYNSGAGLWSAAKGLGTGAYDLVSQLWNPHDTGFVSGLSQVFHEFEKDPKAFAKRAVMAVVNGLRDYLGFPPGYEGCFSSEGMYLCQMAGSVGDIIGEAVAGGAIFDLLKGATQTSRVSKLIEKMKLSKANKNKGLLSQVKANVRSKVAYTATSARVGLTRIAARILPNVSRDGLEGRVSEMLAKAQKKQAEWIVANTKAAKDLKRAEKQLSTLEKKAKRTNTEGLQAEIETQRRLVTLLKRENQQNLKKFTWVTPEERQALFREGDVVDNADHFAKAEGELRTAVAAANQAHGEALQTLTKASSDYDAALAAYKNAPGVAKVARASEINEFENKARSLVDATRNYQAALTESNELQHLAKGYSHFGYEAPRDLTTMDQQIAKATKALADPVPGGKKVIDAIQKATAEGADVGHQAVGPIGKRVDDTYHAMTAAKAEAEKTAPLTTGSTSKYPPSQKSMDMARAGYDRALYDAKRSETQIGMLEEHLQNVSRQIQKLQQKGKGVPEYLSTIVKEGTAEVAEETRLLKEAQETAARYKSLLPGQSLPTEYTGKVVTHEGLRGDSSRSWIGNGVSWAADKSYGWRILGLSAVGLPTKVENNAKMSDSEGAPPVERPPGAPTDAVARPYDHACGANEALEICSNRIYYSAWNIVLDPEAMKKQMLTMPAPPAAPPTTVAAPPASAVAPVPAAAAPPPPAAEPATGGPPVPATNSP